MTPALDLAACGVTAWQATPDMAARASIAAGLLALAGWSVARRSFPGQGAFVALCSVMAGWLVFSVTEHAAVTPDCKGTVALLSWSAILAQPPLWALFLHQYLTGDDASPQLRTRVLLALPSLLLLAGALSNGHHGLWYGSDTRVSEPIAGLPRLIFAYGPLFRVAVVVGYGWLLLAYVLTWRGRRQATVDGRTQWNLFLVLMTVPMAANVAYLAWGVRLLGVDPTSMAFALALVGFAWMITRNRVFNLVPLARRLLFAELPSPVLVMTPLLQVIEANPAAHQLAGGEQPGGRPLGEWPRFGAMLAGLLRVGPDATLAPLHVAGRWYDVQQRPLVLNGQPMGLLVQLNDVTRRQRVQDQMREDLAAREAEQAVLRDQALRDPLTGAWNRRALDALFAAAPGPQSPLALALLDLDHFKRINDTHGHAVGDAVLRDFAAELRSAVRTGDAVFRVGGEEFALLLPGQDAAQTMQRLQRLHERVNATSLGGLPPGLGFSAGVATAPPLPVGLDGLLQAADGALYRAKADGRNRSRLA